MNGPIAVLSHRAALEAAPLFGAVIAVLEPEAGTVEQTAHDKALLSLRFHDAETADRPGICLPRREDVRAALDFANDHLEVDLLIHSRRAVSRAPALAVAVLADWYGPGAEEEVVDALSSGVPIWMPNRLVIRHADALLGRNGALWRAVTEHSR